MNDYFAEAINSKEESLEHHGVLGQKWGVRRFQNKDGSLTEEGKRRVYAQGANYGGYESFRHRHRRAIDAAKYENDIKRNQKKLDKAYEKGNEKKIAKYTNIDKALKNNRDIMTKDLSPEAIQMGRDYITQMKAIGIGTILAGPIGGAAAGMGVRYANKMQETEKKVYEQEAERRKLGNEVERAKKAYIDYETTQKPEEYSNLYSLNLAKNIQDAKDKLHNYDVDQQRRADGKSGAKVYRDSDDPDKKQEYFNKRNSFKSDEDKDLWERSQSAKTEKERNAAIDERVKLAKKTNQYDMEFLERNLDVDDETGEQLKGKALDDAYRKYLQKEKNYYK